MMWPTCNSNNCYNTEHCRWGGGSIFRPKTNMAKYGTLSHVRLQIRCIFSCCYKWACERVWVKRSSKERQRTRERERENIIKNGRKKEKTVINGYNAMWSEVANSLADHRLDWHSGITGWTVCVRSSFSHHLAHFSISIFRHTLSDWLYFTIQCLEHNLSYVMYAV